MLCKSACLLPPPQQVTGSSQLVGLCGRNVNGCVTARAPLSQPPDDARLKEVILRQEGPRAVRACVRVSE